jgi:hypothetical protein
MPDEDLGNAWERRFGPFVRQQTFDLVQDFVRAGEADIARQCLNAALLDKENAGAPMPSPPLFRKPRGPLRLTAAWKTAVILLALPCGWFGFWFQRVTGSDSRIVALMGGFAAFFVEFFVALGILAVINRIKGRRRG